MRNYDGLGGQLLFGYLHDRGVVRWTDNRLLIDWDRVEDGVGELRELVEELYRHGIDTSKVTVLDRRPRPGVAIRRRPTSGRSGVRSARVYSDEAEPRAWIDRVLDDEFPLNMFYELAQEEGWPT